MIRVVLDTNVVVSGLLSPSGPPGRIVDLVTPELIQLIYSDDILGEYADVLHRPQLKLSKSLVDVFLADVRRRDMIVASSPWPVEVPAPTDAVFLEVAAAGDAVLITGNLKHYPASIRLGVEVLTPRAYVDRFDLGLSA